MLINFTKKYQFGSRLSLDNNILEVVSDTKLLGTIFSNDLKWEKNTQNAMPGRMQLLTKLSSFDEFKTFIFSLSGAYWSNHVLSGIACLQKIKAMILKWFKRSQ